MEKPRIICDPNILVGKPTIEGTRLSVELILEEIAFHSIDEMLAEYPSLTREGIEAAREYATDSLHRHSSKAGAQIVL